MLTAVENGGAGTVSRRSKMAAHNRAVLWEGRIGATAPILPLSERGTGVHIDMEIWSEIRRQVLTGASEPCRARGPDEAAQAAGLGETPRRRQKNPFQGGGQPFREQLIRRRKTRHQPHQPPIGPEMPVDMVAEVPLAGLFLSGTAVSLPMAATCLPTAASSPSAASGGRSTTTMPTTRRPRQLHSR